METLVLALGAALVAIPAAAWLHPGRARGIAAASALLALFPFVRGAQGAMAATDEFLPFPDAWKVWVARILALVAVVALSFFLATVRIERAWPLFALAALALLALRTPLASTAGALLAATALSAILRGGFGDPSRYKRIGALASLLVLVAANVLLALEALIQ